MKRSSKMQIKAFFSVLTVLAMSACSTSPTGRAQLAYIPESQMQTMGEQAFTSLKSDLKISKKRVTNDLVQCIANRIIAQPLPSSLFNGEWEIIVFDDPQANAFALPGGKVGVYTGLLNVAENQHQLAAVIGHEVAHVIARHANERMSTDNFAGVLQQIAGQTLSANEVSQTPLIMAGMGILYKGASLKFSRDHETEADEIGLTLMAQAGFKPSEAVELWRNMSKLSKENPPEWLSTHPSQESRINFLNAKLPGARNTYLSSTDKARCE